MPISYLWNRSKDVFGYDISKTIYQLSEIIDRLSPIVGLNFANYEGKLLLMNILKEFKIETCEETPDPIDFVIPTVFNAPASPIVLKFSKIECSE